jgi:two-component system, HptB-dependent secretion and biofilm response regulator
MLATLEHRIAPQVAACDNMPVLVAATSEATCNLVVAIAQRLGFPFLVAKEGREALDLYNRHKAGIVVAEADLPGISGIELTATMRRLSNSFCAPVVTLITRSNEHDSAGYAAGADDCVRSLESATVVAAKIRAGSRRLCALRHMEFTQRRAQAIADTVIDGIFNIDVNGEITWINAAMVRIFGFTHDEITGSSLARLNIELAVQPDDIEAQPAVIANPIDAIGIRREVTAKRKDGTPIPLELTVSRLVHSGVWSFVGVAHEIGARKAQEAELAEKTTRLARYHEAQEAEAQFAHEVMTRMLQRDGLEDRCLRHRVVPAQRFSGDVVAATRSSAGRLYVMLADATGHGLAAAISLLPAITVFYGMATRDLPLSMIVEEINAKLRHAMPVGRFLAAALVCIDDRHRHGEVWIGGVPDLLWLDQAGNIVQRFASNRLPLGISDANANYCQPGYFEWDEPGQLFGCSDGVSEARNLDGEYFGVELIAATLSETAPDERLAAVEAALWHHLAGAAADDDISLFTVELKA